MSSAAKRAPVLDASAVLAVLQQEPGSSRVSPLLPSAVTSAVNAAEVLAKLVRGGVPPEDAIDAFEALDLEVVPFGMSEAAASTQLLTPATIASGLSLGDRACLATARLLGGRALTADRAWQIPDLGVEVEFIR